jgi:hypothetical protein
MFAVNVLLLLLGGFMETIPILVIVVPVIAAFAVVTYFPGFVLTVPGYFHYLSSLQQPRDAFSSGKNTSPSPDPSCSNIQIAISGQRRV